MNCRKVPGLPLSFQIISHCGSMRRNASRTNLSVKSTMLLVVAGSFRVLREA
jgi:hypothetical protein